VTPAGYRALIAVSILLGLAGGALDVLVPSLLPQAFTTAMEVEDPFASPVLLQVTLVAAVATLAAVIGLWLFRPWAPRWALLASVLGMPICVQQGANAFSGWSMMLVDLSSMTWGAVLALTFFSPLRGRFAHAPG
jgi:hypothetical protein